MPCDPIPLCTHDKIYVYRLFSNHFNSHFGILTYKFIPPTKIIYQSSFLANHSVFNSNNAYRF